MRITGSRMIDLAAAATAKNQTQVGAASAEVSSGLRVARSSDDPAAWAAGERAKLHRSLTSGASAAVQASRDRLDQTDAALATIGEAVSEVRQLAVQGSSASYNAEDRAALATQIRALLVSARGAANARSSDGEYLLAGSRSLSEPFDAAGNYAGDAARREVPMSEGATTFATVSGSDLTAASGVDVLPLLERVAAALAANDPDGTSALLTDLETAVRQVGAARTRTGNTMSVLDATKDAQAVLAENLEREIARSVETDTIEAASALAKVSQSLEASRAVTSHVIRLLDPL
jgi:flagellar hook-associated protein 3 FlgL